MEEIIIYMAAPMKVNCDEKCDKAWGIGQRPTEKLSLDPDDVVFLSDGELGTAPKNPGTYEGGEGKPINKQNIPNKWCIRECERCNKSARGKSSEHLPLKDWSKRVFNQPWKHQGNT